MRAGRIAAAVAHGVGQAVLAVASVRVIAVVAAARDDEAVGTACGVLAAGVVARKRAGAVAHVDHCKNVMSRQS